MMTQPPDLDATSTLAREAKARADRATPGPWAVVAGETNGPFGVCAGRQIISCAAALIERHETATFIAAARTDVPAIADAVLALVERVRELSE